MSPPAVAACEVARQILASWGWPRTASDVTGLLVCCLITLNTESSVKIVQKQPKEEAEELQPLRQVMVGAHQRSKAPPCKRATLERLMICLLVPVIPALQTYDSSTVGPVFSS